MFNKKDREKEYVKIYMEEFGLNYASMTEEDIMLMKFTIDTALDKDKITGRTLNKNEFSRLVKMVKKHNPMKIMKEMNENNRKE